MKMLVVFVSLLSNPAWAGWTSVGEDHAAAAYADTATIVRKGEMATMWSLLGYQNFRRMVEVGYFSQKTHVEYDCAAPRLRGLSLSLHSEKMGEGKAIYEDASAHDWESVAPNSLNELLWKTACK